MAVKSAPSNPAVYTATDKRTVIILVIVNRVGTSSLKFAQKSVELSSMFMLLEPSFQWF